MEDYKNMLNHVKHSAHAFLLNMLICFSNGAIAMEQNSILIDSINQQGNIKAIFECDHQVCYLYLHLAKNNRFATHGLQPFTALWVSNQTEDPDELNFSKCDDGFPPLNSKDFCQTTHKQRKHFDANKLYFVWLPEGNGVALYTKEQNLPIAIIPPWAIDQTWKGDQEDFQFSGYSYNAKGNGPLAWELTNDNELIKRFADAKLFWEDEKTKQAHFDWISARVAKLDERFGEHYKYFAIDDGKQPPKALVYYKLPNKILLITLGISLRQQPFAELHKNSSTNIELAAMIDNRWSDNEVLQLANEISKIAELPWNNLSFLDNNHTVGIGAWKDKNFTAAVLTSTFSNVQLPEISSEAHILWLLPITTEELQQVQLVGAGKVLEAIPETRWKQA